MGVTSKQKDRCHGYELKFWKYAGLKKESWVRIGVMELRPDMFRSKIGMLHQEDIEGIRFWLNELL
jgi:hypothetical protein